VTTHDFSLYLFVNGNQLTCTVHNVDIQTALWAENEGMGWGIWEELWGWKTELSLLMLKLC
jgi:hypothetical protein